MPNLVSTYLDGRMGGAERANKVPFLRNTYEDMKAGGGFALGPSFIGTPCTFAL